MLTVMCCYKGNLVLCAGDDSMSGFYPDYENSILLVEKVNDIDMYGIMFDDFEYYKLVEDSWDGFQPTDLSFAEQLEILKQFAALLPSDFLIDRYGEWNFIH